MQGYSLDFSQIPLPCVFVKSNDLLYGSEKLKVHVSFGGFVYSWSRQLVLFESCLKYRESNHPLLPGPHCLPGREITWLEKGQGCETLNFSVNLGQNRPCSPGCGVWVQAASHPGNGARVLR